MKKHGSLLALCEGAICVAMAFALSFLKIPTGGFGGSISLVMVPLMVFALRRGGVWGLGACFIYGCLDFLSGGGLAITWQSIILDYVAAYTLTGVAGFFPRRPVLGTIAGGFARYVCLVMSGVFIWGEYMSDIAIFGSTLKMSSVWVYSLIYNAQYMILTVAVTAVCVGVLSKTTPLTKNQWLINKNS